MKIVNVCKNDWANFMYDNMIALRVVDVDCEAYKLVPHGWYNHECNVVSLATLTEKIKQADVVQIFHSDLACLTIAKQYNKRIIVYHTGTVYRQDPVMYNDLFNPVVERSIIALPEFSGKGSKNETHVVGAVDIKHHIKKIQLPYQIAHYPSNPVVKGTKTIERLMGVIGISTRHQFICSTEIVNYRQQIERLLECDIYIEMFNLKQGEKQYGSFGITALEAAAMGKIVITNNLNNKVYEDNYGDCGLMICNTEIEFIDNIEFLIQQKPTIISNLQIKTRNWIIRNHSYIATGLRLKKIIHEN